MQGAFAPLYIHIAIKQKIMETENIKKIFCGMERLYHFTTFETALQIIESKRQHFGKLKGTNDICENSKVIYTKIKAGSIPEWYDQRMSSELSHYQQMSLTSDGKRRKGFDLQQMWGMYADNGNGVCLVYDKKEIVKALSTEDFKGPVTYKMEVTPDTTIEKVEDKDLTAYIKKNKTFLFFRKRKEWEWEQEYRIIRRSDNPEATEEIDISKALKFIIVCKAESLDPTYSVFGSKEYKTLKKVAGGIPILTYSHFCDDMILASDTDCTIWSYRYGCNQEFTPDDSKLNIGMTEV